MIKRFLVAILNILITALKFVLNMLTIGISFLTKKDIPFVEEWAPSDNSDEKQEALDRQKYMSELHNSYESPIKY